MFSSREWCFAYVSAAVAPGLTSPAGESVSVGRCLFAPLAFKQKMRLTFGQASACMRERERGREREREYIYVCVVRVCQYIYTHTHTHIHLYCVLISPRDVIYVCMYVCIHTYVCMYVYIRMYVCMHIRMYVCMHVFVCVCVCVCVYFHTQRVHTGCEGRRALGGAGGGVFDQKTERDERVGEAHLPR